ncbi:hypothetical protein [Telluribacter sp.]|jgi:hypothetical protein|uniref:hypothetical protein n=1 Tax=Telluribacter sp. TaxID=1978767 RepID=UPI002E161A10|nr:hypothetical protein [Telluribacter sp.]
MKKLINTLSLVAMISIAFISCEKDQVALNPQNGPQKNLSNARGGPAGMVTICHNTGSGSHTITINANALTAHLNHGDKEGGCDMNSTPK